LAKFKNNHLRQSGGQQRRLAVELARAEGSSRPGDDRRQRQHGAEGTDALGSGRRRHWREAQARVEAGTTRRPAARWRLTSGRRRRKQAGRIESGGAASSSGQRGLRPAAWHGTGRIKIEESYDYWGAQGRGVGRRVQKIYIHRGST
jgi:hypothetical protein